MREAADLLHGASQDSTGSIIARKLHLQQRIVFLNNLFQGMKYNLQGPGYDPFFLAIQHLLCRYSCAHCVGLARACLAISKDLQVIKYVSTAMPLGRAMTSEEAHICVAAHSASASGA